MRMSPSLNVCIIANWASRVALIRDAAMRAYTSSPQDKSPSPCECTSCSETITDGIRRRRLWIRAAAALIYQARFFPLSISRFFIPRMFRTLRKLKRIIDSARFGCLELPENTTREFSNDPTNKSSRVIRVDVSSAVVAAAAAVGGYIQRSLILKLRRGQRARDLILEAALKNITRATNEWISPQWPDAGRFAPIWAPWPFGRAARKFTHLRGDIIWHLITHVQSNVKMETSVRLAIHTPPLKSIPIPCIVIEEGWKSSLGILI